MSELRELAESVFGDSRESAGYGFDAGLWAICEETGLARLTLPEAAGGSEGSFADAATVLAAAGRFAARVPLVETDLLAGWLLHVAGIDLPAGPLSAVAAADLEIADGRATGRLRRVPWGRAVAGVAVLTGERVVLVDTAVDAAGLEIVEGTNVAEEPRDDLVLTGSAVRVAPLPEDAMAEFPLRAALGRSLLLAGASRGALEMAVRYATERVQFGRPIAKLQAIQQTLALAAAEVAAAEASSATAARQADRCGVVAAASAIAAAKARTGEAAGQVARIAHQVHGAIGFTREHDLRLMTTRLWAWRDEDGADAFWHEQLGEWALQAGQGGLWATLTGTP
jgi:acyl-CoA dehydrogenase